MQPIPLTIVRIAVGLGFGAFGILLELGLDQVVGLAPWLVVAFAAALLAAVLGGAIGGVIALVVGAIGQVAVIPAWIPGVRGLQGAGWQLELATTLAGFAIGIAIRRMIIDGLPGGLRRGGAEPVATDAVPPADAPHLARPTDADLAVLETAIRDFGAVRTPIQAADALARHALSLSWAASATVYLPTGAGEALVPVGRSGTPDPGAPAQLSAEPFDRRSTTTAAGPILDLARTGVAAVPLTVQTGGRGGVVGVLRLRRDAGLPRDGSGSSAPPSALLPVVVQLAADALERVRLDGARRAADDDAASAGRRLAIVGRLALELVGARTIDEVGRTLIEFAIDDLAAGFAIVHVADDGSGSFRLVEARGVPAGLLAGQRSIARDAASPVTRAAAGLEPIEITGEDGWREAFPRTSNVPAITGVRSISAIPMAAGGVVHGVLTIGWRTAADRAAADRGVLAAAAAQGAQALERAILHAHDEDARRFQEAFIGVVSHELRTPITTILAGSRLLKRRLAGNESARELSDDIEIEADRLTRIVDDLLVLSRLERRHLTIGDDPVHLDHLLARVVRSESARWPTHDFEVPRSPNRHVVLGDETYVEQVLRNLISNAAKYSPAGTTIRVVVDDAPGGDVEVRVLDQGPGVAPGEVDDLFSLFYRSASTSASAAGAGIGLFVSRQLVTEMGGRVWAQPRPEGGSEFGFSLAPYPIDEPEPFEDDGAVVREASTTVAAEPTGVAVSPLREP